MTNLFKRNLFYLLSSLFIVSCGNNTTLKTKKRNSFVEIPYLLNAIDTNIINNSDRKVDVLFNGVNGFLKSINNQKIQFNTECIQCEPILNYNGNLLFGKRLLIKNNHIEYHFNDLKTSNVTLKLETMKYSREKNIQKFDFLNGRGTMEFNEQSCDDADYVNVKLYYEKGSIEIKKILNPCFFEYDLNNDGIKEQYLLGLRNCSQELVLLRITK